MLANLDLPNINPKASYFPWRTGAFTLAILEIKKYRHIYFCKDLLSWARYQLSMFWETRQAEQQGGRYNGSLGSPALHSQSARFGVQGHKWITPQAKYS
jgi:hypothetical protein